MKILDVIKCEQDNALLVWKHPAEDFNTASTLIVHESQEAVFFKNGQVADVFPAGRYVLKTENIPVLRRIMNLPTGGEKLLHVQHPLRRDGHGHQHRQHPPGDGR